MIERCAAVPCSHDADVWAFSPRVSGLVPSCVPHHLDVVAGGVRVRRDVPVLEREVRPQ